ncbi:MAG: hypothetical protein HQL40_12210, partial [Alphaproteobacteria bacterium]|nr:hypothetical protein [Alphaproteobacteria bacterium]
MEREPIRIRLIPRVPFSEGGNPREAFWRSMGQDTGDPESLEGRLCHEFGPQLRRLLVEHLSGPFRDADKRFFVGEFGERVLFRYFEQSSREEDSRRGQAFEAFARLLEQRQQIFRESPALKAVSEKVAATGSITFAVKIAGYSSISLDLSVGPLKKLAEVFDNDFDSFRVFLEAFVPRAYAGVFNYPDAQRLDCSVQIPDSFAKAFAMAASPSPVAGSAMALPEQLASGQPSVAREKAEWLWKLANGSLLLPVALSLGVLYLGMSMLHDIGKSQNAMMSPIFEHQMRLLEEDRRRLFKEAD